jgi:hypothetical protein
MFGDTSGFMSTEQEETSEKYNALVDKQVKEILDVRLFLLVSNVL